MNTYDRKAAALEAEHAYIWSYDRWAARDAYITSLEATPSERIFMRRDNPQPARPGRKSAYMASMTGHSAIDRVFGGQFPHFA